MCRRSEVCNCVRSKSNSSDTCSAKGVITEDTNDCRNNKSACVFGVLPSILPSGPQRDRNEGWGIYGGTARRWFGCWHRQGHAGDGKRRSILFTYLSFSPPKQRRNAWRGERRRRGEDRWLWGDNRRGRSRLIFLPNVWFLPILNRLLHALTHAHPAVCVDHGGVFC